MTGDVDTMDTFRKAMTADGSGKSNSAGHPDRLLGLASASFLRSKTGNHFLAIFSLQPTFG